MMPRVLFVYGPLSIFAVIVFIVVYRTGPEPLTYHSRLGTNILVYFPSSIVIVVALSIVLCRTGGNTPPPSPSPSPVDTTLTYTGVGCYVDAKDNRVMDGKTWANTMSAEVGTFVSQRCDYTVSSCSI